MKGSDRCRAAIIGLGRIGNQFDDDPKRAEIWTHAGAYTAIPEIDLVAGADPDRDRVRRFVERRGGVHGYYDYREMLRTESIHILSICSPTSLHYEMVLEGVRKGVQAIFCEKPLASTMAEAVEMVEACESAGVILAVNHTRRWEGVYIQVKQRVTQGAIGRLESVVGHYPGKVFTMGTHLFDLMRYFGGEVSWVCGDVTQPGEEEWNLSGYLHFQSGVQGTVVSGGCRTNHIFELDLLGSEGRFRILDDGARLEFWRFEESPRYSGYRELSPATLTLVLPEIGEAHLSPTAPTDRFVNAVRDLWTCVQTGSVPACSGRDGMAALEMAWAFCESAKQGNVRVELPLMHPVSTRSGASGRRTRQGRRKKSEPILIQ